MEVLITIKIKFNYLYGNKLWNLENIEIGRSNKYFLNKKASDKTYAYITTNVKNLHLLVTSSENTVKNLIFQNLFEIQEKEKKVCCKIGRNLGRKRATWYTNADFWQ